MRGIEFGLVVAGGLRAYIEALVASEVRTRMTLAASVSPRDRPTIIGSLALEDVPASLLGRCQGAVGGEIRIDDRWDRAYVLGQRDDPG